MLERLRAARLDRQRSAPDLDGLVRSSLGLHSTDYASPYLSARARIAQFDPADLLGRLHRGAGLVRVNAYRNTVHVVHADDLPIVLAATGPGLEAVGRKAPALKGLGQREVDAGVDALRAALDAGPLGNNELKAALPALASDLRSWLQVAMGRGHVVRADGPHARSNRTRYALAARWVPGFRPGGVPAPDARRQLLIRAVRAYGPVTVDDLAWWLPAPKREVVAALASGPSLTRIDEDGVAYWFATDLADLSAPPREALGAWLLPYEDALLKGYADRSWCLAPGLRDVIFARNPSHWRPPHGTDPGPGPHGGANTSGEARPSIWWGGRVVGRWEEGEHGVVWQLHADVGAEGTRAIEDALDALDRFLRDHLGPLCQGG